MARPTYHHGDLLHALLDAATDLARSGGPNAVTLREVARRTGVSPAAIYRHVPDRESLLGEVARIARQMLARRMLDEVLGVDETEAQRRSIARFRAVGRGYLEFADSEPNLLAAAFLPVRPPNDGSTENPNPWQVLADALDELVETGAMPAARRPGAETVAWSTIHGFAVLRAGRAFMASGDPNPESEAILDAIARSIGVSQHASRGAPS